MKSLKLVNNLNLETVILSVPKAFGMYRRIVGETLFGSDTSIRSAFADLLSVTINFKSKSVILSGVEGYVQNGSTLLTMTNINYWFPNPCLGTS